MKKITNDKDSKIMVLIPKGEAKIGSENGYDEEKPVHTFKTNGFYMDVYPVTNAEYKIYCDETGRSYPANPPWSDMPGYFLNYPCHPVVNVSYDECAAYAAWAGKRLPSEEEWEYAAKGGKKQDEYPWGSENPRGEKKALANFADKNSDFEWRDFSADDGYRYTSPVGSFEPNGYGLFDMSGNVFEYVNDWFFLYSDSVKSTAGFNDGWGGSRVCRGGCYHSPANDLRISRRRTVLGGGQSMSVGFRCVKDITENEKANKKTKTPDPVIEDSLWKDKIADLNIRLSDTSELCCGIGTESEKTLKELKSLGFTSVEQYVTWASCEGSGYGKWNFSKWDAEVEKIKSCGLKWLPFIIAGPAYSLPEWYRESRDFEGCRCVEHNMGSKIQSFWDKNFYIYIERYLKKLSEHYKDHSIFEGVMFGISGDFGEAITSVWHGNWPTQSTGIYHAHAGYWCNDRFARADFKVKMRFRYKNDILKLNNAWGTGFKDFESLDFPEIISPPENFRIDEYTAEGQLPIYKPQDRVRIVDFIDWYRKSMTDYVDFWMRTARKYFSDTELYLCTGGEAQPCHASEFAWQSKVCAKSGGGVRITNEDSHYEKNFCITNWVASACTFYNGYFSFEPAGQVTERGVVCRIYNASATGAKGLHYYTGNLLSEKDKCNNFAQNIKYFYQGSVKRDIAALLPDVPSIIEPRLRQTMYNTFFVLRDYTDYVYADDLTIKDGILNTVKALIITVGGYYRKETLNRILKFVKSGGILIGIALDSIHSIENSVDYTDILFSSNSIKQIQNGKTLYIASPLIPSDINPVDLVQKNVFDVMTNFFEENVINISDGKLDKVYTAQKENSLIVMNYGEEEITRSFSLPGGKTKSLSLSAPSIDIIEFN